MGKKANFFLWVIIVVLIVFRYLSSLQNFTDGTKVKITDRVLQDPIRYDYSQRISLSNFKIYLPLYPEVYYGDVVTVEGVVNGSELKDPVLINIQSSNNLLFKLRKKLLNFYNSNLPEPHSSLVSGMVLGSKANIPDDFWVKLKSTGTAHVVVASGMNATLVAGFLMSTFLIFVPRRKAVIVAILGVWFYALLAGFEAPIIRASIMVTVAYVAMYFGRVGDTYRSLFYTGALMLLIKPLWITDLGFILSFSATLSLILFEAKIKRKVMKVPGIFREGLSTSLSAQVLVLPILFFAFGTISLTAPISNALVLWTVPIITNLGMIAGITSLIWEFPGKVILMLSFPLTSWFIGVIDILS